MARRSLFEPSLRQDLQRGLALGHVVLQRGQGDVVALLHRLVASAQRIDQSHPRGTK
jgi:hypothetical protein